MLEFFAQHGPAILAGMTALGSLVASVTGLVKVFKTNQKINAEQAKTQTEIQITREGIIEAFKAAKIPNEWKVTVSKQVEAYLTKFRDDFITMYKENEQARNLMMVSMLKILNFTAASNKLTEDEKKQIDDLIKMISDEDSTIDIGD